jgi:predicted nucleic acid-binding protein
VSKAAVILDTGPLVAYLWETEPRHGWAVEQIAALVDPPFTCEPVLTETFFLLGRVPGGRERLFDLLSSEAVVVDFAISLHIRALDLLIRKYRDLPMSLADACLVRMAEQRRGAAVLTLDRHFSIYRLHGRQPIPTIMP